jgi:hypothetical protein
MSTVSFLASKDSRFQIPTQLSHHTVIFFVYSIVRLCHIGIANISWPLSLCPLPVHHVSPDSLILYTWLIAGPRRIPEPCDCRPERTVETAKAAKPNHKKAVTACASWHRFAGSWDPFVIWLLSVYFCFSLALTIGLVHNWYL